MAISEQKRDAKWERLGRLMDRSNRRRNVSRPNSSTNVKDHVSKTIDVVDDTMSEIEEADEFLKLNAECIRDELEASAEMVKNIDPKTFEKRKKEMLEGFEKFFEKHPELDTPIEVPWKLDKK